MSRDLINQCQIFIRSSGERTEDLCRHSIIYNGVREDQLEIIKDIQPFSEILKEGYKKALKSSQLYTFFIDADMVLFPNSLDILLQTINSLNEEIFFVNPLVYDYISGMILPNGPHLYKTELLKEAINYIPADNESLRPESYVVKAMQKKGYKSAYLDIPLAWHEFEQYYKDLFIKTIKKYHKFINYRTIIENWINRQNISGTEFKTIKLAWELAKNFEETNTQALIHEFEKLNIEERLPITDPENIYRDMIAGWQKKKEFKFIGYSGARLDNDVSKSKFNKLIFRITKDFINKNRKKNRYNRKVYPGENIFDYLLDLFPFDNNKLQKPIFIIGSARAGTSLAFSFLEAHVDIACMYEGNKKWMYHFRRRRDSDQYGDLLFVSDINNKIQNYLYKEFNKFRNRERKPKFAEKDPRNSIRLDFIYNLFPDALFVVLYRNPYDNICSLVKRHDNCRKNLQNHKKDNQWWRSGDNWAEQRIPGWKKYRDKPLIEAATYQYKYTMLKLLKDLGNIPKEQVLNYKYEKILENPIKFQKSLYFFCDLPIDRSNKHLLNTIREPASSPKKDLSKNDIEHINKKCKEIFEKLGYEAML